MPHPYLFDWPDSVDQMALAAYLVLLLGVPLLGYAFFVMDVRAYLRSLRRYLVRLGPGTRDVPAWAVPSVPVCLATFGLRLPCTEEDLLTAYRREVKRLHPDRGGDRGRFMKLQRQFEDALALVRDEQEAAAAPRRARPRTHTPVTPDAP